MKKTIILLLIPMAFSACKSLRGVESNTLSPLYGNACSNPTYVATLGREAGGVGQSSSAIYNSSTIRLSMLLNEAQQKYGPEVTITNVRWDLQNGKRRSVVFDVIKCK